MIEYVKGNLLADKAEALVNTVNTVGVMGKGIALEFKKAFPKNYEYYRKECLFHGFHTGALLRVRDSSPIYGEKLIINFPTKQHWSDPSKYEYIEEGLWLLQGDLCHNRIKSLALPALGCGNGGLDWHNVKKLIHRYLYLDIQLVEVDIRVYEPG